MEFTGPVTVCVNCGRVCSPLQPFYGLHIDGPWFRDPVQLCSAMCVIEYAWLTADREPANQPARDSN